MKLTSAEQVQSFESFFPATEQGLRYALVALFGAEDGRDAALYALLYGWQFWDRVREMVNPAGDLYLVGQTWGRHNTGRAKTLPGIIAHDELWVEPRLPEILGSLPEKQRVAVVLRYGADCTYRQIAELLGSSEASVRKNVERGLIRLPVVLDVAQWTPEIVDQLRSYLQAIETVAPPITVEELEQASRQIPAVVDGVGEYPVESRRLADARTTRHRRWMVAAVAAASVLAVVSFGMFGDGDERQGDQSSGPTQIGVDDLTRQIAVVQTWAAAYNGGRLEEYLSHFSATGVVVGPAYELIWGSPTDRDTVAALMAASDRMDSGLQPLCSSGAVLEPAADSGYLSCWLFRRDRFHSPAVIGSPLGFDPTAYWASPIIFTFDEDDMITSIHLGGSPFGDGRPAAVGVINDGDPFTETEAREAARPFISYRTEFMDWLQTAHPDVAAQIGPGAVGDLPAAEDMATSLEYMAVFVDHAYPKSDVTAAFEAAHDSHVATIEAMLGAYNQGDLDEWLTFFPDGINLDNASGLSIELEQAFMAANGRWTLAFECDRGRVGYQPFYAVVLGVDELTRQPVRCPTTRHDDFYGAGGIGRKMTFEFHFDAGHLVGYETTGDVTWIEQNEDWFDPHADFARDFLSWLRDKHPDIAADFNSDSLITAEDMPTALEHVDQFVAQSDTYP